MTFHFIRNRLSCEISTWTAENVIGRNGINGPGILIKFIQQISLLCLANYCSYYNETKTWVKFHLIKPNLKSPVSRERACVAAAVKMSVEPPPFQEASRCDVCKCSFSTFRRRHHCRCCGRTLCAEHSSDQMTLPQFGIHTNVRVCADCFNDRSSILVQVYCRLKKDGVSGATNEVNAVTDTISRLDIDDVSDMKPEVSSEKSAFPSISECKCGMPLCICEAPAPSKDSTSSQPFSTPSNPPVHSFPKPKKTDPTPKSRGSTSNSRQSNPFNPGQVSNSSVDISSTDYEVTGEGLREAIKNGDTAAAKKLLSQGVNANYRDKQGSSLLHLAAVFNQTEIAFALMDHKASLDCKNSQGETPLDCAPATLQYKMKQKMKDDAN